MKWALIIIGLLCFFFTSKAQVKTELNVLYIVDGVQVRKELIKPEDIYSKDVVRGEKFDALYGYKGSDTLNIITTKIGAKRLYQNKLGEFSREYKSYIENHNNDDSDLQYIVHSDPLEKQEVINFLYKLPQEKIISVTFTANADTGKKTAIIDIKVGE